MILKTFYVIFVKFVEILKKFGKNFEENLWKIILKKVLEKFEEIKKQILETFCEKIQRNFRKISKKLWKNSEKIL